MKYSLTIFIVLAFTLPFFAQPSPFIQVDQFGYKPLAEKVAVLSNPIIGFNSNLSYQPPAMMEVRRAVTNETVLVGDVNLWNGGAVHNQSGDMGWWFDFSGVQDTGHYYIYDPLNNESSGIFRIAENPYIDVLKAAGRMYFYNRCNDEKALPFAGEKWQDGMNFLHPLQDANCRYVYDKTNAALEKDLRGGWFDAGDYNKYVSFTFAPLHDLLFAYEENPQAFGDDWNIPESKNGFPDIIDEVKWELDWLMRMTNADGSAHNKMGSIAYDQNALSPPSANTDPRYYGPTCSSASITIASVLSHAAVVFKKFKGLEGYAVQLQQTAETCFNYCLPFYLNNNWETNCDDGSINSGDCDESVQNQLEIFITACVYLYELTGDETYHDYFKANYLKSRPMSNSYWSGDYPTIQDALIRYAWKLQNTDKNVQLDIQSDLKEAIANNWNDFFGWNDLDLYRAFVPDWTFTWGGNKPNACYGILSFNISRYKMVSDTSGFVKKGNEQLHYFHGVNPLGMVWLSNMYQYGAFRCANQIYHSWFKDGSIYDHALNSPNGPAPGFMVGGPNIYYSITSISPPANQPAMKSYLDFNNDWPDNSWEITEPSIYVQAAYIRLLAYHVTKDITTKITDQTTNTAFHISPNPANQWVALSGINFPADIVILDVHGRTVFEKSDIAASESMDISKLNPGLYFINATNKQDGTVKTGKLSIVR